jgi:hypothetical protein
MCVPSRGFLFCRRAEGIKQKQQQEKGERKSGEETENDVCSII